jgi:hypothetical protein
LNPNDSLDSRSFETDTEVFTWDVCVVADKLRWLGRVEAENEAGAVAWGAQQFDKDPKTLIVVKRRDLR